MTTEPRIQYRKLPGARRGLIRGASVWAGPDHLLLVRSYRFREEYKRYYYRDVQAIAIANAPRFHISTRSLLIGWLLLVVYAIFASRGITAFIIWLSVQALLAVAWAVISGAFSCRCRIYTAVSSDELPSVYRSWTARRFLAAVDPLISGLQGALEGQWAEAASESGVGPETARVAAAQKASIEDAAPARNLATDLFIASLIANSALHFAPQASADWYRWLTALLGLAMLAGAIGVLIARQRKRIRSAMQTLAIFTVVAIGVSYYVQVVSASVVAGMRSATTGKPTVTLSADSDVPLVRQIRAGIEAALALAGIILSIGGRREAQPSLLE
jgi:hypothetical protein